MSSAWNKEDEEDMETLAKSVSKKQNYSVKKEAKAIKQVKPSKPSNNSALLIEEWSANNIRNG